MAALRGGAGGEPPGPLRAAEAGSVPSEAGASGVHPEGGRAAKRPLGVPALEDKIVQRAVVEVLNAIYERTSSASRTGSGRDAARIKRWMRSRSAILTEKVNWVLDADIRGFFDTLDHGWLVRFLEHRVADRRVVRLIQKWLNAGVLEDGQAHCE